MDRRHKRTVAWGIRQGQRRGRRGRPAQKCLMRFVPLLYYGRPSSNPCMRVNNPQSNCFGATAWSGIISRLS